MDTIRRYEALRQMELHEDAQGNARFFSLQYYNKKGEVCFIERGRCCGVKPGVNMKASRMRNIISYDKNGKAVGHPTLVSIDALRMFNGMRVKL